MAELILSDGTRSFDFLAEPVPAIYVQQDGLNLPVVSREDTYAEGSDSEGRTRVRSRALNSEAGSFSVFFKADNADDFWDAVDNLQELVESAHRNKGTITYTPPGGVAVTFDLETVNVTDLPQRGVTLRQFHGEATVSFESKPYGRLAEVSIPIGDPYAEAVASFGNLAMLLPLGNSAGLTDLSGNARNGTAAGSVTVGGYTPGPLSLDDVGATDFDGTDDRITTTYNPFTNGTTRTFMGWAWRDTDSGQQALFSGSAANAPLLRLQAGSNSVNFYSDFPTVSGPTWAASWPGQNQWVHWALVFNETSNDASLYINGALVSTQTQSVAYNATPGNFQIATYVSTTYPMNGKQAWVSVHTAGLTADQVAAAYSAANPTEATAEGPIDWFTVADVSGQVSAWGELTLSDDDSQARNHVEVGVQHGFDPDNAEPLLYSANSSPGLTALGGSGNTRSGSYATNVIRAALTTSPVAVCAAVEQPHKGLWKVRVRVYPSTTDVRVRLAWRAGDGPFASEKWVRVPNSAGWYDLDLGTVNVKELPSGHTADFRVEAFATSGVPTVDVDIVTLLPCDNYTRLRGSVAAEVGTGAIVAIDDFSTQTAGNVSGKTPLLAPAGNWSGAGDADDFTVDTTNQWIQRTAVSDTNGNTGRYLRCGSGVLAQTTVYCDIWVAPETISASDRRQGVFLRYTDANNWLMAYFQNNGVFLDKRVSGTVTNLYGAAYSSVGRWNTLTVGADAAGNAAVAAGPKGGALTVLALVLADSNLVTAGTLDDGGYGIYDAWEGATTATRLYDNFSVSTLATSASIVNPAINEDYGLTLLHNTSLSDNADGDAIGTTPVREGKYLTLPPATRNGDKSRIVVRARRQDVDSGFADDGLTDSLTAQLSVTPRVHLTGT